MKNKRISFSRAFYNNKFALFFSFLMAVILWGVMVSMNTEKHAMAITDVPIDVTLPDSALSDGMKVFSQTDKKATVYVKGNSLIVKQLKSTDLEAVAALPSNVSEPGSYTLPLTVRSKGTVNAAYTVDSIYPSQILVTVDRYKEKTFAVQSDVTYKAGYQADPAYFVGMPDPSQDTVTISGPEKQVLEVNRIAFSYEIDGTLKDTKNFTAPLNLYDANGNKLDQGDLTINPEKVDVTIPVLPREVLTLEATFTNKPSGLAFSSGEVLVNPKTIEVAAPKDVLANLKEASLAPIDFSEINPSNNTFEVNINLPPTCKNLSNIPTAKVSLNLAGMSTRQMEVTNFTVKNLSSDKTAQVYTKSMSVMVVGPDDEVSRLTDANLTGLIDLSDRENFTGHTEIPVTFSISNTTRSWVYGSYMANLEIRQKNS